MRGLKSVLMYAGQMKRNYRYDSDGMEKNEEMMIIEASIKGLKAANAKAHFDTIRRKYLFAFSLISNQNTKCGNHRIAASVPLISSCSGRMQE